MEPLGDLQAPYTGLYPMHEPKHENPVFPRVFPYMTKTHQRNLHVFVHSYKNGNH